MSEPIALAPRPSALALLPGLLLSAAIAALAFGGARLQRDYPVSPILLAIVFGIAFRSAFGRAELCQCGNQFAQSKILRAAIILLGFQLTLAQLAEIGLAGLAVVAAAFASCFLFTRWLARGLGIDAKLAELIAAGTSICGVSAIVATNAVTRAREEDVAYAVACVTLCGTVAMLVAPLLAEPLGLAPKSYGLWVGASVHEIAQVVAASFQVGEIEGQHGSIAKLTRVMMLVPLVVALGLAARRRNQADRLGAASPPLPWFILGFLATVCINSAAPISVEIAAWLTPATTALFTVALAALGLETDWRKLRSQGAKPLILGAAASLLIAAVSLALVRMLAP
jgi:uncharacterized integral membrane protein (TIGR00698 family)